MPRFANAITGVIVNVSEVDAENLGADYAPVKVKAAADEKPARRTRN